MRIIVVWSRFFIYVMYILVNHVTNLVDPRGRPSGFEAYRVETSLHKTYILYNHRVRPSSVTIGSTTIALQTLSVASFDGSVSYI